jgi:hypothetical protein
LREDLWLKEDFGEGGGLTAVPGLSADGHGIVGSDLGSCGENGDGNAGDGGEGRHGCVNEDVEAT